MDLCFFLSHCLIHHRLSHCLNLDEIHVSINLDCFMKRTFVFSSVPTPFCSKGSAHGLFRVHGQQNQIKSNRNSQQFEYFLVSAFPTNWLDRFLMEGVKSGETGGNTKKPVELFFSKIENEITSNKCCQSALSVSPQKISFRYI
jgi:hypothetical protein